MADCKVATWNRDHNQVSFKSSIILSIKRDSKTFFMAKKENQILNKLIQSISKFKLL